MCMGMYICNMYSLWGVQCFVYPYKSVTKFLNLGRSSETGSPRMTVVQVKLLIRHLISVSVSSDQKNNDIKK